MRNVSSNLSVAPESLSGVAGAQSAAAGVVTQQAAAERFDAAELVPTFGLIGAPFLAALAAAMSQRAQRLDTAAAAHAGQAVRTVDAASAYIGADAANANGVAV